MLAVDARTESRRLVGGPLMVEALATMVSVHLIRHFLGPRQLAARPDGVLPHRKLRTVIEYIMENLEGSPTLEQIGCRRSSQPLSLRAAVQSVHWVAASPVCNHAPRLNGRSTSCGQTVNSAWRRSRSASDSYTKATFPFTSSGSSASRRDSFGFPQESRKSPQALGRNRAAGPISLPPQAGRRST